MFIVTDNTVKYVFNYDNIYTEVTKRTSKLGQHRGTEKLMHLLAQMSMTKDESFIFSPQIRQACALVWEQMYPLAKFIKNAYRFNVETVTKTHRVLPKVSDLLDIQLSSGYPQSLNTDTNEYTLTTQYALSNIGTGPDWSELNLTLNARIFYDVFNLHDTERRVLEITRAVSTIVPPVLMATGVVTVLEDVSGVQFERFDGNLTSEFDAAFSFKNPETFNVGEYVEYGNELYLTIKQADENTDINNTEYFTKLTADDRGSIIFEVNKHDWLDENVFPLVNNAIFETIVHFIMYSWFETTAPDESVVYEKKYKSDIVDLRHRIQSQNRPIRNKYKWY